MSPDGWFRPSRPWRPASAWAEDPAQERRADSCWLAEVSEAALLQGRFWPVRDALLDSLAELGLDLARLERDLASGQPRASVREDVALCAELGLTATPSVVLGGHVLRGGMPPWMVDEVLSVLLDGAD